MWTEIGKVECMVMIYIFLFLIRCYSPKGKDKRSENETNGYNVESDDLKMINCLALKQTVRDLLLEVIKLKKQMMSGS